MIYRAVHHCFSRFDNSVVTCEKKESQFIQSQQSDYTDDGGGQYRAGRGQMNQVKEGSWSVFMPGLLGSMGARLLTCQWGNYWGVGRSCPCNNGLGTPPVDDEVE